MSTQGDGVIANAGGTFQNAGTIRALGATVFLGQAATLTNSGTIASTGYIGIQASGNVDITINNSGAISGPVAVVQTDTGDDTFNMSGGSTVGIVDLGGGSNTITLTGGAIGNGITTSRGPADTLVWRNGGTVIGAITLMGNSNTATLSGLTEANLQSVTALSSGAGTGTLTFDDTQSAVSSRYANWTTVNLTHGSSLALDNNGLTLGSSTTGTGILNIDATSTLLAGGLGDPAVVPLTAGQVVTVNNAGTLDLTSGGTSTSDALVIQGDYVGQNGRLRLQTILGGDASPSDKLVIEQGTASGTTAINIVRVGGAGALTTQNGILVVQGINGATTAPGAFGLSGPVMAGAYVYDLFRGGVTAGTAQIWYLRSSVAAVPLAGAVSTAPVAAPGSPPLPAASTSPVPLYRMEVPVYAEAPEVMRELGVEQPGTFHDRQGDQDLLSETGALSASWGRAWGEHLSLASSGAVDPAFSGASGGFQIGQDLYATRSPGGQRDHRGVLAGYLRADGNVTGFALGFPGYAAGHLSINAYSLGGYWTHIGPTGWYTDMVVLGSTLTLDPVSNENIGASTHGSSETISAETGLPFPLGTRWSIEPQLQLIWQHASIGVLDDGVSTVAFHLDDGVVGRVGVRM